MSEGGGGFRTKVAVGLLLLAMGFAGGYWVRGLDAHRQVQEALARGRAEAEAALARSARAGKKLQEGTRAAAQELVREEEERP